MEGRNPPFPPNFVPSTRHPDDRSCSAEEKPDSRPLLPPNYVSLRELRERRLKEEQEREKERRREGGKASEGPESADQRHPSYITVRELEEELLREAEEKERKGKGNEERVEGKLKEEEKEKAGKEEGKERKLKELRQDKNGDDSGKIEKKINKLSYGARNLSSKEADRVCHVKSGWVWEPKLLVASSSMISSENAGASHEVLTVSCDQNGAPAPPQINPKKKWKDEKMKKKKKEKRKNWKRGSGKDIHEPALNAEQPLKVTKGKVAEEVTLSQNGNNKVRKVKGENTNLNEASTQLVPVLEEAKRLNGRRSRRIRGHKGGDRTKNKEANLCEVKKGFDGVKEATGTEIETGTDLKGKGKMVNMSESIDTYLSHEEAKEIGGSEVIRGRGKNVTSSEWNETGGQGQFGEHWRKWNLTAGSRGRGHPRAGRFPVRPSERLSGGGNGFVWVPKNSS